MQITTKDISTNLNNLPISRYINDKDFLIFDIETTGFSRDYAIIYMIGFICKKGSNYTYYNLFADCKDDESQLIEYFINIIDKFNHIISFNGNNFDIPFLKSRAKKHNISFNLENINSIDIYELLRPFRTSLVFKDLKLDTIQEFLGYKRKDTHTGGSLIKVYKDYIDSPSKEAFDLLLLHNKEDAEGMIYLLPIMDLFLLVNDFMDNTMFEHHKTYCNNTAIITYKSSILINIDFKLTYNNSVLLFEKNSYYFKLIIPIYSGTKKLFFDNYKDYVYVSSSNEIMHKSLAMFLAPSERTNVRKSDCYIEYSNDFIPIFFKDNNFKIFKDDYKDLNTYTNLESLNSDVFLNKQLTGFLNKICTKK